MRRIANLHRTWAAFGVQMWVRAMDLNIAQMSAVLRAELRPGASILDLGCGDGTVLGRYAPSECKLYGVDGWAAAARKARTRGVEVCLASLEKPLPLRSEMFAAVTSNQVLEHLYDTDLFVSEAFRLLRPGGIAVVSTENLAAWHNVASLALGWQAFSLGNVSSVRPGLGNPLALPRENDAHDARWAHRRVFSYRGLKELFAGHGFVSVRVLGAGYFPLPGRFGQVDPRHAAFITIVGRRPA